MSRIADFAWGVAGGLLLAGAACIINAIDNQPPAVIRVAPAPELAGLPRQTLDCQAPVVYQPIAKKKLALPDPVQKDITQHLTAAIVIPGDEHPHTVSAVYNDQTGITDLYARRDPLPWIDLTRPRWSLELDYGLAVAADTVVDSALTWHAAVRYDPWRIKALRAGAALHGFGTGARFLGVGIAGHF